MSGNIFNNYVEGLLTIDIEKDKFEQYIDLFSKFLGYVNPDYKYNGTYLTEYVSDFMQIQQALKSRNEKYHEIFIGLSGMGENFELIIDRIYYAKYCGKGNPVRKYVEINKSIITSNFIEIKITIENKENTYLFCKKYDVLDNQLSTKIFKDVRAFMDKKNIRRSVHGTT